MIIDAKSGMRGVLVNADTGERIPLAFWANLETGEYRAFRTVDGKTPTKNIAGQTISYDGKSRLRFIETGGLYTTPPPTPSSPTEYRTLERCLVVPGRNCEAKGCSRLAEWETAVERLIASPDGFERAVLVGRRRWCSWHYRLPYEVDEKGEVVREIEVATRPQ